MPKYSFKDYYINNSCLKKQIKLFICKKNTEICVVLCVNIFVFLQMLHSLLSTLTFDVTMNKRIWQKRPNLRVISKIKTNFLKQIDILPQKKNVSRFYFERQFANEHFLLKWIQTSKIHFCKLNQWLKCINCSICKNRQWSLSVRSKCL